MRTTRSVTAVANRTSALTTAASVIMWDTSNSLSFTLASSLSFTSTCFPLVLNFESSCEFSDLSKRE